MALAASLLGVVGFPFNPLAAGRSVADRGSLLVTTTALLVLAAAFVPAAARADQGDRVALVIGNGAYGHLPALDNPINDARDMAALLWQAGFETIELIDANHEAMLAGLATFAKRLTAGTAAAFYYAGHGVQNRGAKLHGDGVQLDQAAAITWLERSAAGGNPWAQRDLGRIYLRGDVGAADAASAARYLALRASPATRMPSPRRASCWLGSRARIGSWQRNRCSASSAMRRASRTASLGRRR